MPISRCGTPATGTTAVAIPTGEDLNTAILVAIAGKQGSASMSAFTWPSGWTVIAGGTSGSSSTWIRLEVAWYFWKTGDPSSFTITGTTNHTACVAYHGVNVVTPVLLSTAMATGTTAMPTTAALNNTNTKAWRVSSFGISNVTSCTVTGYTISASGGTVTEWIEKGTGGTGPINISLGDSVGTIPATNSTATATKSTTCLGTVGMQFILNPRLEPNPLSYNTTIDRASSI